MPTIGVTGGIATGKSTFCDCLRELLPAADYFNADEAAQAVLREQFGDVDREALRASIFADPEKRRELEKVIHPRVRAQWEAMIEPGQLLIADIPLLYETGGDKLCDRVIVVACSRKAQRERLLARSNVSGIEADQMIAAQLPIEEKITKADHVVWNNGDRAGLMEQARLLVSVNRWVA